MNPKIVFCITCKGRTQHIERTLPQNLTDNQDYSNAKFVLLDYNSQDHLLGYLKTNHQQDIENGRLVVYSYPEAQKFQMAHAKNMAHRCGLLEGADILCNLDADNFTGPDFAGYIAEKFADNIDGVFLWANRNQPEPIRYPKGCNGRIVVSTHAFLKTGGYDENLYNTWGPDDKDFNFRLRRLGYLPAEIARKYLEVILHNDKMRFREYAHLQKEVMEESFQAVDETATIANYGKIGMGTVYKNFEFASPIELKALPTRIFGIGMHKTGTTSLHTAFRDLGYDSGHWKSVRWAKNIWQEMRGAGKSVTLESSYALSDLPIPILFRQLDVVYPGSKFILTTRNEDSWLKSIRHHWSKHNQHRDTWNKEGSFAKQMHKEVYGQEHFDPSFFLARFRRHNAEVLEYFKKRPNDLLVMDMSKGAGWKKLCDFLGQPIPDTPYPFKFVTGASARGSSGKDDVVCSADHLEKERTLYSGAYFRKELFESNSASVVLVPLILEAVDVKSVLDVGCGVGAFLRRFKNHGVADILGVDGDYIPAWVKKIPESCFHQHDLKRPLTLGRKFDVVMCLEVAEHLPKSAADTLVESLCRHGDVIVFSAAVIGQGGVSHINEQSHEYWEAKFAAYGYKQIDWLRPRLEDKKELAYWYRENMFLYANANGLANIAGRI